MNSLKDINKNGRGNLSPSHPENGDKMRNLVSIQKISDLSPIEGADRIEVATINGWKVVVQKGLYQVGDLTVYCEIDTVLPLNHFPELEKVNGRIKTIKLRGQISQGYCIPMEKFWEILETEDLGFYKDIHHGIKKLVDGNDVTDLIGATKYEPPMKFKHGDAAGNFPSHILPKTDEDRIQSNPKYLEKFEGKPWVATVKYDGTSATFGYDEDEFFACSRNLKATDGDNVYWNIARKYNLDQVDPRYVIQGEICGPGIQKNRLELKEIDFFVFMIYDQVDKRYLSIDERLACCRQLELKHVKTYDEGSFFSYTVDELLKMAEGKYPDSKNEREGLVFELADPEPTEFGGRLSFKVINNKFLLKGGD